MRAVPLTTSAQTSTATTGTEIQRGTPKISSEPATPANSATVLPRLASSRASMTKKVDLTPNRSRIRSERPFPVTTPIRAVISCTTINARVMGISVHRSV